MQARESRMWSRKSKNAHYVTIQRLLISFREALEFYRNEIYGMDAFEWEAFPKALIVSDGKIVCDTIADRIT